MADQKLSALSATCSVAAGDYLYTVLSPTTSPLQRHIAISDFENSLPNKITGANLGTGIGVYREKTNASLLFKTLVGGANVTLSSAASTVTISGASVAGEANTAVNLGTGIEVFREKSGVNLNLRTFIAGDNTTISSATSAVTISSTDTSNTAANLGAGGYGLFKETQANQHQFKTIVAGTNISLASAASTITITNSAAEAASTGHFTATIGASNTWNNELIPLWQAPRGGSATILEIDATTSGTTSPTLNFNLQIRNWDSMALAGTDVFAASQAATSAGEILTTLATSVLEPRSHLMFTTGSGAESGSVNFITLSVYYHN